jgi:hypothetical protein
MYQRINEFNARTNIVKDEKGDFFIESLHIFVMSWNYFSQLSSVHGVSDLRQTEIHTAQSIVPELSDFEVEMVTENLNSHITKY